MYHIQATTSWHNFSVFPVYRFILFPLLHVFCCALDLKVMSAAYVAGTARTGPPKADGPENFGPAQPGPAHGHL